MSLSRRQFAQHTLALAGASLMTKLDLDNNIAHAASAIEQGSPVEWLKLLATGIEERQPTPLRTEGKIPDALRGTLYRNGPGLFRRGGETKGNILDGDGMVQALRFDNGGTTHQCRFVQTPKLIEEEEAGEFLYPTWTTKSPAGFLANVGGSGFKTQAGITVYNVAGRLMALDEVSPPYELDPTTLQTMGPATSGLSDGAAVKAHTKIDGQSGEWVLFGNEFGPTMQLEAAIQSPDGNIHTLPKVESPRQVYMHDFMVTENHVIFNLMPAFVDLLPFLSGYQSFADSLDWRPAEGNILAVMQKDGGSIQYYDVPGRWMWHAANAYEHGNTIIADFVGYNMPDHFLGGESAFQKIMSGELGQAEEPGRLYRYTIDLESGQAREELIVDTALEFPGIHPKDACHTHRRVYTSYGPHNKIFHSGIAATDTETGNIQTYDFGENVWVGEPIFVPASGNHGGGAASDDGWLIAQGLDGITRNSFYAILSTTNLADGPVAITHLEGHLPYSFHGHWTDA
ncbi:MAG TPA: hypothetical protein DD437_11605 [Rhodobiaceae bacterium]|nr:hypothetical protein [Rhodobiaceae bacterium]|tara:strand:+ start:712 stop:2250 length:1539 start_codon:yes stop_codon:yes gene_type:complete